MPKVVLLDQASEDLDEIWFYIAQDSPENADRFIDSTLKRCQMLAEHPDMGQDRDETLPDLQSFPVGNYVIFYRATDDGIEIIRVLHGARDLPGLI